jgi:uncharacterized protein YndB with AHSA1/START domain
LRNHWLHVKEETVIPDRIEREILIEAPPEVVWGVLTEPEQITQWFSDGAEVDVRTGADGVLTWDERGVGKAEPVAHVTRLRVETVERPHFFSFRWDQPEGEEPREGNSLLVEFSLTPDAGGTRLRVVESGLRRLERTDEEKIRFLESHTRGWELHLGQLRDYVARGVALRR